MIIWTRPGLVLLCFAALNLALACPFLCCQLNGREWPTGSTVMGDVRGRSETTELCFSHKWPLHLLQPCNEFCACPSPTCERGLVQMGWWFSTWAIFLLCVSLVNVLGLSLRRSRAPMCVAGKCFGLVSTSKSGSCSSIDFSSADG